MFLIVVASALITANPSALVGTWQGETDRWTFKGDGTGSSSDDPTFRWKANEKKITLTFPDNTFEPIAYQLNGDKLLLVLDDGGEKIKLNLNRLAQGALKPQAPQPGQAALVGTWGVEGMKFVVLGPDGRAQMPSPEPGEPALSGVWTADVKTIRVLYSNGTSVVWPYVLKGNTLSITDQGERMPLQRMAAARK